MKTTKNLFDLRMFTTFAILLFIISACKKDEEIDTSDPNSKVATDYSISSHWLSIPATVYPVDVFYFYPTAWTNSDSLPKICAIDDSSMMVKAPEAFSRQATVFSTVGNIYAPYYRQDNLSAVDRLNIIAGIPTLDAIAAFDYYIKHFNKGRPYILAGHSQGSNVLSSLLAGYMKDNPQVYARMIAAYVIGFPVTAEYLANNPHLKFAQGPDDTGVIISYNTQAPDVLPGVNPVLYGLVGKVINPITWTRDETIATTAQGLGSFMPVPPTYALMQVPQYADAKVDTTNGVLICSTANASLGYGLGIFHSYDYAFYYFNLRENAANRVQKFLNKKP